MVRLILFFIIGLGVLPLPLFSQTQDAGLRRGIEELQLGKGLEEMQDALQKSPHFQYRGPRDVSFLPKREDPVIDTEGLLYIKRGLFQFQDGVLIAIILYLNPRYLDYPTLFQHLSQRYGPPLALDPKSCYWEDEQTRITLEKPLVIKFLEKKTVSKTTEPSAGLPFSPEEEGRQRFLELS